MPRRLSLPADSEFAVHIEWDNTNLWQETWKNISNPNMLQSFEYGETKRAEGWIPLRGVLIDKSTEGLVQILTKNKFGARIFRLNRGPLFSGNSETQSLWLSKIRTDLAKYGHGIFFFAPENLGRASFLNFRWKDGWHSSKVPMAGPEESLIKTFDSKWRNMVRSVERKGLTVSMAKDVEFFWQKYVMHAKRKGYQPLDKGLLSAFKDKIQCFEAKFEGHFMGGVMTCGHGNTTTYLAGFTEEGAPNGTNNLLLWEAIRSLKRNYAFFDVGGISDTLTPGVAKFKRGLNGIEYKLSGEFLSFL